MELLELFTKAIAPQVLTRIFDNIPQYVILFGFIVIFIVKYLLKWNKARVEKLKAKEERSQAIFKNTENLVNKVDTIEKSQKEAVEEIKVLRTDYNALHTRVAVIETENRINSKQEGTIITMLNRIFNSIEKK
jgi:peptidoglycan hydrolase CwlO-like protein